MALKVWLPLSGNAINLGLNAREASTEGTVMYASGLFGDKCFNSGSGSIAIPITSVPEKMSLSVWVKFQNEDQSGTILGLGGLGDRIDYLGLARQISWQNEGVGMLSDGTNLFRIDEYNDPWYNLIVTADGSNVTVYVDGTQVYTAPQEDANEAAFGSDATIYIGAKADGSAKVSGYIQDFKMFDHILSKKEISEIAKGLMLEYTFNHNGFGNENLLTGSERELVVSGEEITNTVENDRIFAHLTPGTYTLSAVTTGHWSLDAINTPAVLSEDPEDVPTRLELYTKYDDNPNNDIETRTLCALDEDGKATITISDEHTYYVGAIAMGDGMTTAEATIAFIKLEHGTVATPWLPNKNSELYDDMQIGSVENDTSGNNLNGTISDTAPEWSSDSALFSGSYDFSNGAYIQTPVLDLANNYEFTVSFWAKASVLTGKSFFGFNAGLRFNFSTLNNKFAINNIDTQADYAFSNELVTDYLDEWHHYALVISNRYFDNVQGSLVKLYIDGVKYGSDVQATGIPFGTSKIRINGYNSVNGFNGLMSDFRLYARALSADQIKALYSTRAGVDNTGKVFAAEFVAGDGNSSRFVSKSGVMNTGEMSTFNTPIDDKTEETDDATVFKFGKDKIVAADVMEV